MTTDAPERTMTVRILWPAGAEEIDLDLINGEHPARALEEALEHRPDPVRVRAIAATDTTPATEGWIDLGLVRVGQQ